MMMDVLDDDGCAWFDGTFAWFDGTFAWWWWWWWDICLMMMMDVLDGTLLKSSLILIFLFNFDWMGGWNFGLKWIACKYLARWVAGWNEPFNKDEINILFNFDWMGAEILDWNEPFNKGDGLMELIMIYLLWYLNLDWSHSRCLYKFVTCVLDASPPPPLPGVSPGRLRLACIFRARARVADRSRDCYPASAEQLESGDTLGEGGGGWSRR